MNELRQYDNAAKKFYAAKQIKSFPLNSWDCYSEYFEIVLKSLEDMAIINKLAIQHKWSTPLRIEEELLQKQHVVVVTDAHLKIVHATHNMLKMNGYTMREIVGKTPKMFQGEGTCAKTSHYLSNAIRTKKPFEAIVLNYRKDGSTYKCLITGQPIFNSDKEVVHFIAYKKEVV